MNTDKFNSRNFETQLEKLLDQVGPFFRDRIGSEIRFVTISNKGYGYSTISQVHVSPNWPLLNGSIRFTRDVDKQRFSFTLKRGGKTFKNARWIMKALRS